MKKSINKLQDVQPVKCRTNSTFVMKRKKSVNDKQTK